MLRLIEELWVTTGPHPDPPASTKRNTRPRICPQSLGYRNPRAPEKWTLSITLLDEFQGWIFKCSALTMASWAACSEKVRILSSQTCTRNSLGRVYKNILKTLLSLLEEFSHVMGTSPNRGFHGLCSFWICERIPACVASWLYNSSRQLSLELGPELWPKISFGFVIEFCKLFWILLLNSAFIKQLCSPCILYTLELQRGTIWE